MIEVLDSSLIDPFRVVTSGEHLQGDQLGTIEGQHPRHPIRRHRLIPHHAHWFTFQTTLRTQCLWSWTPPLETGGVLALYADSGVLYLLICLSSFKGLIWFFIATISEVLPAVSGWFHARIPITTRTLLHRCFFV